jgi:hypothetical protein
MLINLVEAVSCENPRCAEFAKTVNLPRPLRQYFCPTCSKVSPVRGVDAQLLGSRDGYARFLRRFAELEGLPG